MNMLMVMMVKVTVILTMALRTNLAPGKAAAKEGERRGGSVVEAGCVKRQTLISLLTCVVFLTF